MRAREAKCLRSNSPSFFLSANVPCWGGGVRWCGGRMEKAFYDICAVARSREREKRRIVIMWIDYAATYESHPRICCCTGLAFCYPISQHIFLALTLTQPITPPHRKEKLSLSIFHSPQLSTWKLFSQTKYLYKKNSFCVAIILSSLPPFSLEKHK